MRKKGLQFYKKRKKLNMNLAKEIGSWLIGGLVAVFLAIFMTFFFGAQVSIIGVSMESELQNGQIVLVNQLVYDFVKPGRGDVIAFLPNGNHNSHYYVKRIIGLPGDQIQIKNGFVYINDELLEESYDQISDGGMAKVELIIPENEYFVLGDNRNNSEDSRASTIGMVSSTSILGKVWLHYPYGDETIGFVD